MIFVLHADQEPAELLIDGRLMIIPPNEPFEVPEIRGTDTNNNGPYEYIMPDHQVAAKIREHAWFHGMVEVPVVRTATSITADVDSARIKARDALMAAQDGMLAQYVRDQQDRIKDGKSALPPGGRIATIIERRGIDLKREFNIDPPGWTLDKLNDRDVEMAALRAQNETMQRQMAELLARFPVRNDEMSEETKGRKR